MNTELIKLFNATLVETPILNFAEVNAIANTRGYLIHPNACNTSVLAFLQEMDTNYNSTFYKTFEDVTSKSRLELWFDQVLHYCTTYGTDFALSNGYVPNDELGFVPAFEKYKVIMPISEEELCKRCFNMLTSGIALKESTMKVCADYIIAYAKMHKDYTVDVDAIKNREAVVYICDKLNIVPQEKFNLFRYIIYVTTKKTMIIKNAEMINAIKNSATPFDFSRLSEKNMEALASIFLRYKDIFLAFKHGIAINQVEVEVPVRRRVRSAYNSQYENTTRYEIKNVVTKVTSSNAPYINKLRKMAIKLHEPMKESFWQTVFNSEKSVEELMNEVNKLTNFKKVAIMQNCIERAMGADNQFYLVRNQKTFLREGYKTKTDVKYAMLVYSILRTSLLETLIKNSTKEVVVSVDASTGEKVTETQKKVVRFVDGVSIALPTSEKSFIGNYPFGTTYMISDNNYFGVYWRNEWGTHDYDLSFLDINGNKIGWNSDYYDSGKNIIFSGDMTNAEPEASEVLYMKKSGQKGVVKINQYNGEEKSKFRFFFGQSALGLDMSNRSGYMVDPNSIVLTCDVKHENCREQQVAVVDTDRIVLMAVNTGNGIVSRTSAKYTTMMQDAIMRKAHCFVSAEELLTEAGYTVVGKDYTGEVDIDFANLDKDSLISLMSDNN